jgi:uncharacterized protein YtpQ (UPF0354 family)
MFERNANEDQQSKIYVRYLEFCNLKRVRMERIKFSYNYKKKTMRVEARNHDKRIEFNIDDFIDWDRANYPDNPCMS